MSMEMVSWRKGYTFAYKADAGKVVDEVRSIGESATTEQILDMARDPNTEMHKCFTWDNDKASENWRRFEARTMVAAIVIRREPTDEERQSNVKLPEVRVFHKLSRSTDEGYKPLEIIVKKPDEYERLLACALRDMESFVQKYRMLSEVEDLIEMMENYLN